MQWVGVEYGRTVSFWEVKKGDTVAGGTMGVLGC